MFEKISFKDLIALNQRFDRGRLINESSLRYALAEANRSKSWLRSCAVLVRAVLLDRVFEEGNKRTAAAIVVSFFEGEGIPYEPEKIAKGVVRILMKNMTEITAIERVIRDAIVR